MKKIVTIAIAFICSVSMNAQSMKETFDSNSLDWNECASESNSGTSVIDKGVLTITSKGVNKFWTAMAGAQVGENTYFTCCCYAPLNVQRSFKISTNVTIGKLDDDKLAGLIFNYKDDGNFYAFVFNDEEVRFMRIKDMKFVGSITQSVKWGKTRKAQQNWRLESDGSTLSFFVDELPIMKIRYMPLEYAGFGYYTFGKQKLIVDDVEFYQ
jgi:hypothetical protein